MQIQQIRQTFLDYFYDKGHQIVPSSSLVPANDKTLLFANAGMVQFKEVFLGMESRPYCCAATSQKCVRAGGKHNDLENVGYTARHHTFFEMLGNFSFGDYFKEEAIFYAWELITKKFNLPGEKIWITVFEKDDEAYDIWVKKIGISPKRISRIGAKDNFWQMGETGPCGPCTEIFYDHGEHIFGGPPGSLEEDGDRFIEIWNLVFMQYDRQANGELIPLPKPSVDTGMGLERIAAILQGVNSNYEIDLFVALIAAAANVTNTTDLFNNSLKVIADHIRSVAFLLSDGVVPTNDGRGYVLRRIIRRAVRHGYKLGQKQPFFYKLIDPLVAEMGQAYPELKEKRKVLKEQIFAEEERFNKTIEDGMGVLEADIARLKDKTILGETLFKLYDTYGFPLDLTADIARERGLEVDLDGYDAAMQRQVKKSRTASSFKVKTIFKTKSVTKFLGYKLNKTTAKIIKIFIGTDSVDTLTNGEAIIVLDRTPFYGESGGQIGDIGKIKANNATFIVTDTQKQGDTFLHIGYLSSGKLIEGQKVSASIANNRRQSIKRNHSATHLLHAALRQVLGNQVEQKGSLVTSKRLRFDFSYNKAVSKKHLDKIEDIVNADILANYPVQIELMSQDEAKNKGALALFGEKYKDEVRVLTMGPNSIELCGGTHVERTGNIGQLVIINETGVASGIRRIEAVTGWNALSYCREKEQQLHTIANSLKTAPANIEKKIEQLLSLQKQMQKQIKKLKQQGINNHELLEEQAQDLAEMVNKLTANHVEIKVKKSQSLKPYLTLQQQAKDLAQSLLSKNKGNIGKLRKINEFKILTARLEGYDIGELRDLADQQRDKQNADLVFFATVFDDKVKMVISVAKPMIGRLHAGEIISKLAKIVDGKGGGRPDFAQAGGSNVKNIDKALASIDNLLS